MVALTGGRRRKSHTKKHSTRKKIMKRVSVAKKYVKPGNKAIARDPLHKAGKVVKSGKKKGLCKVVLTKRGAAVRSAQLARKPKRKSHRKK